MSDATFQFVCHFDSQSSEQSDMCVQITQENELYNNETVHLFFWRFYYTCYQLSETTYPFQVHRWAGADPS